MKVLNLLTSGSYGGIEVYCRNIGLSASFDNGYCFLFGEGGLYELMMKDGLTVYSLSEQKKMSIRRFRRLKKVAESYDIVVVHHEDPFLLAYFMLLRITYPNKKFVQMLHSCFDNYSFQGYGTIKKVLCDFENKMVASFSDKIIAVSKAVKKSYSAILHRYQDKIIVVYNGIGKEILDAGGKAPYRIGNTIELLYVGRLSKEKGIDILIDALERIDFEYKLTIVGDGNERDALEEKVKIRKMSDSISFEGFKADIRSYLERCNIFISPTLWEAFGISIVEAMAYGRICVSNEIGGIPEIIEDKKNGFLSQGISPVELRKAIEEAVQIIDRSDELRQNARKTAENFTIKRSCVELEKVYMSLLVH